MNSTSQSTFTHFLLSLLLSFILLGLASQNKLTWLTSPLTLLTNPLRPPFYHLHSYLNTQFQFLRNLPHQQRLINDLNRRNAELSLTAQKVEELTTENAALKSLLSAQISPDHHIISAKVISLSRFAILNQGRNAGITSSLPVVIDDSLVGITTTTSPHTTRVRLLNDPETSLEVTTLSGVNGQLIFENNSLILTQVPQKEILKPNEPVFTAGQNNIPHGLLVGHITQINNNESSPSQSAIIVPAAKITQYQYLFVLLD